MSYDRIETSDYEGSAIYLYEFRLGSRVWRYTSADSDVSAGGAAWESAAIEHDGVSQTGEAEQDNPNLTVPSDIIPAQMYLGTPPTQEMQVTFRKAHDGSPDAPIFWVGLVSSVNWPVPGTVQFSLVTLAATLQRQGLTLTYQRGCRNVLYGTGRGACNAPREPYRVPGTVVTAARGVVQISGISGRPDGWFNGGYMEWIDVNRGLERRTIEQYRGHDEVVLFGLSDGLYEGLAVNLYPGCPRTMEACDTKFGNIDNYGGQPHLPGDSPFDGRSLF